MKYTESDYSSITKYLLGENPAMRYNDNYFGCISLFDNNHKHPFVSDIENKMQKIRYFIKNYGIKSFLDVGCGMGAVLFSIDKVNNYRENVKKVHGIELEKKYIDIFYDVREDFFNEPETTHIFQQDALDFNGYNEYGFVFAYNPISNRWLYKKLIEKIWNEMKVGSYFFDPYNNRYEEYIPMGEYEVAKTIKFKKHNKNNIIRKL